MNEYPKWIEKLKKDDMNFIRNFIMASGSLKEIAKQYNVTYPTIRLRLDRLIQTIQMNEAEREKPFVTLVKTMAIEERLDLETARQLIDTYNKESEG